MKKVFVVVVLAALIVPLRVESGQSQAARIGILGPAEEPRFSELLGGLRQGLRDRGYSDLAAEILEGRVTRGDQAGAHARVEEFARQRAQVLFVIGSELARLARQVSSEMPIVFITPGDPVAAGLVASLAKPGSNMTGMTFEYPELSGKRLELLKEMITRIRRVLVLYDPRDASPRQSVTVAREVAPKLGLKLLERETRSAEEITRGLDALKEADAFLAIPGGLTSAHYKDIISAANAKRKATMFNARTGSTLEALASYGASDAEIARQVARLVDKIIKGEQAGDLPVERPRKLELVINLKTAKQIGVTIPPNLLVRANKVMK